MYVLKKDVDQINCNKLRGLQTENFTINAHNIQQNMSRSHKKLGEK